MKQHLLQTDSVREHIRIGENAAERQAVLQAIRSFLRLKSFNPDTSVDITLLWQCLEGHGLGGMIGQMASRGLIDNSQLREFSESRYLSNILHNERARRVINRIAQVCIENSIPVAMLKGSALLVQGFSDPGLRGFGDVDLFFNSRADILRLIEALPAQHVRDKGRDSIKGRFTDPAKLNINLDGVEIELMHCPVFPTDSMQNTLHYHRPFDVPEREEDLYRPDPSFHFVFLFLHMSINHFCARLIWFLDLVLLYREQKSQIDWQWVEREFDRLQVRQLAGGILGFCRDMLGSDLPEIKNEERTWNMPFIRYMLLSETVLTSRLGIQYVSFWHRRLLNTFYSVAFYLLGDPQGMRECSSFATRHMVNRFLYAIRIEWEFPARICRPLCTLLLWPFAWLSAVIFRWKLLKRTRAV